jgi:hypothetical protein
MPIALADLLFIKNDPFFTSMLNSSWYLLKRDIESYVTAFLKSHLPPSPFQTRGV